MNCSNCQSEMTSVEIVDDVGQEFHIQQCPSCAGMWFDKNKLYRVPIAIGQKIDSTNPGKPTPNHLKCPHDDVHLSDFKDPNIPASLTIYRCPVCSGMFLFKGQLHAYKEYQKQRTVRTIDISRKTAVALSIFFALFASVFTGLFISESALRADQLTSEAYKPMLFGSRETFLFLSIFSFLLLMIAEAFYHFRKKKK